MLLIIGYVHGMSVLSSPSVATPSTGSRGDRALLRIGAICAVTGTLANIAATVGHGDLPEAGTAAELAFVAGRSSWSYVHLLSIVGVLLWLAGFSAVAQSLRRTPAAALGRLALASAYVGASVHVVFFSIDGYALKRAADACAAATGAQQDDLLEAGQLVLLLQNSQFVSAIAFMLGLPFALFGLAVARSGSYPAWLGWGAVLAGVGSIITGTTRFVGLDQLIPDPVLFPAFALPASLWIAAVGVLMWRRAGRT